MPILKPTVATMAFLLQQPTLHSSIPRLDATSNFMMRYDLTRIKPWVAKGSRVLDLGCGDGEFLQQLEKEYDVTGVGLELDPNKLIAAASRGIDVIQQNIDLGLK